MEVDHKRVLNRLEDVPFRHDLLDLRFLLNHAPLDDLDRVELPCVLLGSFDDCGETADSDSPFDIKIIQRHFGSRGYSGIFIALVQS